MAIGMRAIEAVLGMNGVGGKRHCRCRAGEPKSVSREDVEESGNLRKRVLRQRPRAVPIQRLMLCHLSEE
jgi:hypothetical protein